MSGNLLKVFWDLAHDNDSKRLKAANSLVAILSKKQSKKTEPCSDLEYTLSRLIKGLTSNREMARPGYSLALTQVLRKFNIISIDVVLSQMEKSLETNTKGTKKEVNNILLGRVMVYLCLIQASRLSDVTQEQLTQIARDLISMHAKKGPMEPLCLQAMEQLVLLVPSPDIFEEGLWPLIQEQLSVGWKECSSHTLHLLIVTAAQFPNFVSSSFLEKHWDCAEIICEENFDAIGLILMRSATNTSVHPVVGSVMQQLKRNPDILLAFWKSQVEPQLVDGKKQGKKNVALYLASLVVEHLHSDKMVSSVLSGEMISLLAWTLGHQSSASYAVASQLVQKLTTEFKKSSGPDQMSMLMAVWNSPSGVLFDAQSKTSTLATWVANLKDDQHEKLILLLENVVLGKAVSGVSGENADYNRETQQKWAATSLCSLACQTDVTQHTERKMALLQFLFVHAFFKVTASVDGVVQKPIAMSHNVQTCLQDAFSKALLRLVKVREMSISKDDIRKEYINFLHGVVQFACKVFASGKGVAPLTPFSNENKEVWSTVVEKVEGIRKKMLEDDVNQAFELLYLFQGLQLFYDTRSGKEVVQDLNDCYKEASRARRKSIAKPNVDGPTWVEVVLELLLQLLSHRRGIFRSVVKLIFGMLIPHVTEDALQVILDVLSASSDDDDDGQLAFEDDEAEEVEGQSATEEEEPMEEDAKEEEEEEEEDDDDEEEEVEEEMEVGDDVRSAIKQALGSAAAASDDDDDEESVDNDLDDDAMMALDENLSAVFKSLSKKNDRKADRERARALLEFRMKCLELLEVFVHSGPKVSLQLSLMQPMLTLIRMSEKDKNSQEIGARARKIFMLLCKPTKMVPDAAVDKDELPSLYKELLEGNDKVSGHFLSKEVASACLYVVRVMLGLQSDTGPSPLRTRSMKAKSTNSKVSASKSRDEVNLKKVHDVMISNLKTYCNKRDSDLNHTLFINIFTRQPSVMWPISEDLLSFLSSPDVRIFCKTQVATMLSAMFTANTVQNIGQEDWEHFAVNVLTQMHKIIEEIVASKTIKPKFLQEVLQVLNRLINVSQKSFINEHLPESLFVLMEQLKLMTKSEGKSTCNRIIAAIRKIKNIPQETGKKKKDKKKKRKADNGKEEATPVKKAKKEELNEESKEDTPSGKKKKNKKRKSNVQAEEVEEVVAEQSTEEGTPSGKKKNKKRKSLGTPTTAENSVEITEKSPKSQINNAETPGKGKKKRKSVTPNGINGIHDKKKSPIFSPVSSKTRRKSKMVVVPEDAEVHDDEEKSPSPKKPTPIAHKTRRKSMLLQQQQQTPGKSTPKSSKK